MYAIRSYYDDAIMQAINSIVENKGDFIGAFRENVLRVIGNYNSKEVPTKYDEHIEDLQNQMLNLIENNAKNGDLSDDFDEEYVITSYSIHYTKLYEL